MKLTIFAAALMLGGAAVAQTTNTQTTTDTTATDTTEEATEADAQTDTTTTTTTTPTTTGTTTTSTSVGTSGGMTVAPGNTAPERDARGIAVISEPAVSPPGWNQPAGTPGAAPASGPAPSMGTAGPLPPCSRTVTDRCTQTYERGRAR